MYTDFDPILTFRFLNLKMIFSCNFSGFGSKATAVIPESKYLRRK